jgi:ubiquinone/menaquinone biosynthesis C-methylase UbiE
MGKKGGHRFAHTESWSGKFFHSMIALYRAILIKFFQNPKNCLDVGCGTGKLVKYLRLLGVDARGIEISEHAIQLADRDIRPFLKLGTISELPYKDNTFDMVLTYDVLERIDRSQIKKALEETVRVSRKYIFHKFFTRENLWFNLFHRKDFSMVSFFPRKYWVRILSSLKDANIIKLPFHLPLFMETKFLLKKKS